jgi:hypothetical protein
MVMEQIHAAVRATERLEEEQGRSRELSLVKTKLEEAELWLERAERLARQEQVAPRPVRPSPMQGETSGGLPAT